jgi:hypothetical protein
MNSLFLWFWTIMIFSSLAWYFFLLFYVGIKGGREMRQMTRTLAARPHEPQDGPSPPTA